MRVEEKLILALDVNSLNEAEGVVRALSNCVNAYKIGVSLFTTAGPESVRMVKTAGGKAIPKVFLDLKLHDIPNTVAMTAEAIARLGVDMFTVHALGGKEMMAAAKEGAQRAAGETGRQCPLVLGVTILTHLEGDTIRQDLGINRSVEQEVLHLAQMAVDAGLDGLICSPREIEAVRRVCGNKLTVICPGIRPSWARRGEQRRSLSPGEAIEAGADYLVIGRPILEATDRLEAVEKIIEEMRNAFVAHNAPVNRVSF
jgi:orotidine-5'-phosphate decarboxylase